MNPQTFDIPEDLWALCEEVLPPDHARPQGGRPPISNYRVLCGILFRLRTGCQWRALPPRFGSVPTVHRRFQQWVAAGIFRDIFEICLRFYDELRGIDWEWASMDGCLVKAPCGGTLTGRNPTDRAKSGTKRSIMTDGHGVPIAATVAGANVHDVKMVEETLDQVPIQKRGSPQRPKHLCLDKGYAGPKTAECVKERHISPHVRKRKEPTLGHFPRSKKRRWVVERANSWHNAWRGLKTRWERKGANYLACLLLASGCIAWQRATDGFCGAF